MPGMNPPPPMDRKVSLLHEMMFGISFLPPILTLFQVKACEAAALTEAVKRLVAKAIP
jgi:hypothetical protein